MYQSGSVMRTKKEVDRLVTDIMNEVKNERERNLRCYHIACQYFKVGDYESTRRYVSMYLSVKEDSPMAHKLLGEAYEALQQKEKAVSEFKRSLELDGNQPVLVLRICQIISENEVQFDAERARYWCERGEDLFPQHPAIFRLKERLLTNSSKNEEAYETLIKSQLKALPNDVTVHLRLLRFYMENKRLQSAYDHILEVENKQLFRLELSWYEYICEFFQIYYDKNIGKLDSDWNYFIYWISAVERLVFVLLADSSGISQKTLTDYSNSLLRLDKILSQISKIPNKSFKLFDEFIKHMYAQFCFHLSMFIFKKAKMDQFEWKWATKDTEPLLICSLIDPPELDAPFSLGLRENHKQILRQLHRSGSYRVSVAGNVLVILSKKSQESFSDKITYMQKNDWREKLYKKIFDFWENKDLESGSFFINYEVNSILPNSLITEAQLSEPERLKIYEEVNPGSLHHLVWLGVQMMRYTNRKAPEVFPPSQLHTYGFSNLPFSVSNPNNVRVENLSRLDIDAFIYATVLCASSVLNDQIDKGYFDVNRPIVLPVDITAQLCSSEQLEWWNAMNKIYKKEVGNSWSDMRMMVVRGMEVVRLVGNHGLDIMLLIQLGRTFIERSKGYKKDEQLNKSQEISALEDRGYLYYGIALAVLEKMEKKESLRIPPVKKLFEYQRKNIEPPQMKLLHNECRYQMANQCMKQKRYEEAIELFSTLKTPYASFYTAMMYKTLAQIELAKWRGDELHTNNNAALLKMKSQEALRLTKERIQHDPHHLLHSVLPNEIIEEELNGDLEESEYRNVNMSFSESLFSPPSMTAPQGDGDFTNVSIHQEMSGGQRRARSTISSTPKSSRLTTRNIIVHSSPPQQKAVTSVEIEALSSKITALESTLSSKINAMEASVLAKICISEGAVMSKICETWAAMSNRLTQMEIKLDDLRVDVNKIRPDDPLYMLNDEDDIGFPNTYQPSLPANQTVPAPQHIPVQPGPFFPGQPPPPQATPVPRGIQGTATVTHGTPPQFFPQQLPLHSHFPFCPSTSVPSFADLPDFLKRNQNTQISKQQPNVVITFSDSLPTGTPPVQAPMSVTIPPQHRMGAIPQTPPQITTQQTEPILEPTNKAPHAFQIKMPASANIPDLKKSPVAAAMAAEQERLESDDEGVENEHDSFPDFKPIIPLPDEIEITTGEEGSKVLFEKRSKLFRFVDKEWKERGIGMLKILQDNTVGKARLLMRREQVHKICANHYLKPDMNLTPMFSSDRAWVWVAHDYAEEKLQIEKLCAKFKNPEEAEEFKKAFDEAKMLTDSPQNIQKEDSIQQVPVVIKELAEISNETKNKPKKLDFSGFSMIKDPNLKTQVKKEDSVQLVSALKDSKNKPPTETAQKKVEFGGFTFTKEPVLFSSNDDNKNNKNQDDKAAKSAEPNPFASFSFGSISNTQDQKGLFSFSTNTESAPKSTKSSILKPSSFSVNVEQTKLNKSGGNTVINTIPKIESSTSSIPKSDASGSSSTPKSGAPMFTTMTSDSTGFTSNFYKPSSLNLFNLKSEGNNEKVAAPPFPSVTKNENTSVFGSNFLNNTPSFTIFGNVKADNIESTLNSNKSTSSKPATSGSQESFVFGSNVSTVSFSTLAGNTETKPGDKSPTLRRPHLTIDKLMKPDSSTPEVLTGSIDFSMVAKSGTSNFTPSKAQQNLKLFEPSPVFQDKSNVSLNQSKDDEDDFVPNAEFTPVIPLPELVTVTTGEEGQKVLYEERAKLLRFDSKTKEWKERGIGQMKILHDPKTNLVRLLMRRELVHKVCCNHRVTPDMELKPAISSDKAWAWYAQDYSEGVMTEEFFALRFKNVDLAHKFFEAIENAKELAEKKPDGNTSAVSLNSSVDFGLSISSDSSYISSNQDTSSGSISDSQDTWKCDSCMFLNASSDAKCRSCKSSKNKESVSLSQMWQFKRQKGQWDCNYCYGKNNVEDTKCQVCDEVKPVVITELPEGSTPEQAQPKPQVLSNTQPLSELFKPKPGSWECSECLVRNNADVYKCSSCGTMKSGVAGQPENVKASNLTGSGMKFTFGVQNQKTEAIKYSFGVPSKEDSDSSNDAKMAKIDLSRSGFSFGVPPKNDSNAPKFNFGSAKQKVEDTTAPSTGFVFGSPKSNSDLSAATFTFGSSQKDSNENQTVSSVAPATSTGFPFNLTSGLGAVNTSTSTMNTFKEPIFGSTGSSSQTSTTPSANFTFGAKFLSQNPNSFSLKGPESTEPKTEPNKFNFVMSTSGSQQDTSQQDQQDSDGEHNIEEEDNNIQFQPIIPLPEKVQLTTGEESEEVLYSHRAKLFRYVDGEWKERGIGDVKILKHRETGKIRLLMRRDTVLKICLNHFLTPQLAFEPKDNKSWLWSAMDFSEGELNQEKFALRFKTPEIALNFKDAIDTAQAELSSSANEQTGSPLAGTATTDSKSETLPKPNDTSEASDKDEDVEVVYENKVSDDLREKALRLQLPPNFYAYLDAPDCPGCRGCPEDKMTNNNASTSTINTITQSYNMFASPSVSSNYFSISSTKSDPLMEDKEKDCSKQEVEISTSTPNTNTTAVSQNDQPQNAYTCVKFPVFNTPIFGNLSTKTADTSFKFGASDVNPFKVGTPPTPTVHEQSMADEGNRSGEDDNEEVETNDPHYDPIVPLPPLVEVLTGEENEEKLFCERAKLFLFHKNTKEWKERGTGEMKILYNPEHNTYRLLLRREQVHKVVCNHWIFPSLKLEALLTSDKAWCWTAMNLPENCEETVLEKLAVRFKTSEIANKFKEMVENCVSQLSINKETLITDVSASSDHQEEEEEEDYDGNHEEEVVDDSDNYEDEYDDEDDWEIAFQKEVTLTFRSGADSKWKPMGSVLLVLSSSVTQMLAQIRIVKDDGEIISVSSIDRNVDVEVSNNIAIWKAIETNEGPELREYMATFETDHDAVTFGISVKDITNMMLDRENES